MQNWFDDIRSQLHFRQFQIGDLLFAEYTCPIPVNRLGIWSDHDCLVHVLSGRKTWHSDTGDWIGEAGSSLYFKKGCYFVEQDFDKDFCLFCFTLPDTFIRATVQEIRQELKLPDKGEAFPESATYLKEDVSIKGYLHSIHAYFAANEDPPETLLKMKLRELVAGILLSRRNGPLAAYLLQVASSAAPDVGQIMEANFRYNLSLDDFARMCNRSLSTFKRDFQMELGSPPGRWLRQRRLQHATSLLKYSDLPITEIAYECGFEDVSHFCKAFKDTYGETAGDYRQECDGESTTDWL